MNHESATKANAPHRIGVGLGAVLVLVAAASLAHDSRPAPLPATVPHGEDGLRPTPSANARAELPDLVGLDLQQARHTARAAGFHLLTPHDATTEDRLHTFARDWKVCAQTPRPGTRPTLTEVDLTATQRTEPCPR